MLQYQAIFLISILIEDLFLIFIYVKVLQSVNFSAFWCLTSWELTNIDF